MKEQTTSYLPLIIVVLLALLLAIAVHRTGFSFVMTSFMGFFLCLLSMFKFFDLNAFVDGFSRYDLITKNFRLYGFVYPFIELGTGLLYVANAFPLFTNIVVLIVMTVSGMGVIRMVRKGEELKCACLGTVLNVPLSTVSIVENLGMSVMAAINIIVIVMAHS